MKKWLTKYFHIYNEILTVQSPIDKLIEIKELFKKTQLSGKKIIFVGNGGSAAIASHCSVDLTKNAGIRAINFNEADLITCFANDFGYEHWVEKAIEYYGENADVCVFISSSGKSPNILNGIKKAKNMGIVTITLSGFNSNNPLKSFGDINLWVNSCAYNIIENTHQIWLLSIVDMIIGSTEYSA